MSPLLLLATLVFHYPATNAGPDCSAGQVPLTDLAGAELHGLRIGDLWPQTIKAWSVAPTMAGEPDTVSFDDQGGSWLVWLEVLDTSKNHQCRSNFVSIGPPWVAGVGSQPVAGEMRFYDIAGRRLAAPPTHGVYFAREGGRTRKHVVVVR